MCTVSKNFKLCSCTTDNVYELQHYWILKRSTGKEEWVVGEFMMPAPIDPVIEKLNAETILQQLNAENCFDIPMQHAENDILEIHLTTEKGTSDLEGACFGNFLEYSFCFVKGRWEETDTEPWIIGFKEVKKGKVEEPFETSDE